jgi:hypothetical protein
LLKVVSEELEDLNDQANLRNSGVLKRKVHSLPAKLPVRKYQKQLQKKINHGRRVLNSNYIS